VSGQPQRIDVAATSLAPPGAVYALLADGAGWPRWSPFRGYRPAPSVSFLFGPAGPDAVGAVRSYVTATPWYGTSRHRQRIEELVPGRRFGYSTESPLPALDWRTVLDLAPSPDGGTRIDCRVTYTPQSRAAARGLRRDLEYLHQRLVRGLALHATG